MGEPERDLQELEEKLLLEDQARARRMWAAGATLALILLLFVLAPLFVDEGAGEGADEAGEPSIPDTFRRELPPEPTAPPTAPPGELSQAGMAMPPPPPSLPALDPTSPEYGLRPLSPVEAALPVTLRLSISRIERISVHWKLTVRNHTGNPVCFHAIARFTPEGEGWGFSSMRNQGMGKFDVGPGGTRDFAGVLSVTQEDLSHTSELAIELAFMKLERERENLVFYFRPAGVGGEGEGVWERLPWSP